MKKVKNVDVPREALVVKQTKIGRPVFKNHFNGYLFPSDNEINAKPSMTVPDQSMSVRELADRFAKGLPLVNGKEPIFTDPDDELLDGRDIRSYDLAEREEMKRDAQDRIDDHNRRVEMAKKAAEEIQKKFNEDSKVLETIPTNDDQGNKDQKGTL